MPDAPQEYTFLVPGQEAGATRGGVAVPASELPDAEVKQSVRIGSRRAAGDEVRVTAVPGEDAVLLEIAGGPTLTLHPQSAYELMQAQKTDQDESQARGGADGSPRAESATAPNTVRVPSQLQWNGLEESAETARGATRGWLGKVLLSGLKVIRFKKVADRTAEQVAKQVDGQVQAGLYRLSPDTLPSLKTGTPLSLGTPMERPMLVLIHGTFSTTGGTFGKLWSDHPERVRALFDHYGNQVYALDHPTLGASPIENALTLAEALPRGARLHLLTHSRGGLVAEALARVAGNPQEDFQSWKNPKDRANLTALAARVREKNLRVERLVRVACPSRGTLLASNRLDAYVSVFKWTLELAGLPVAAEILAFLGAVARRRKDEDLLPGLAAQIPDSPLVQWLHKIEEPIRGDLRVIAGDMKGDSVVSWLKTLMADSFYWTDNDLIVQTRSMYGGAPRAESALFVLDQGGDVSHFNYFRNDRTAGAIVEGLIQDTPPREFRTIGPLSWAGASATGTRAARRDLGERPPHERPALFLLPGITGSNLKVNGRRVWVGWRLINGLDDLAIGAPGVEPDGLIGAYYDDLAEFLSKTHQVIEFAFDWRLSIEEAAKRLAQAVTQALDARAKTDQPVRILAHSMGGLLARALQIFEPAAWKRMMAHSGARLLMLGTPNGGSWAPMQVLSGDDRFGNLLTLVGAPFQEKEARGQLARFPGFLQLQAGLVDGQDLQSAARWAELQEKDLARVRANRFWHRLPLQIKELEWGLPTQAVLDSAVRLRRLLDQQKEKDLPGFKDKLLLVIGQAPFTPNGFEMEDEGLAYLDIPAGDGRVTRESALLPGVRTWTLNANHGGLPRERDAFEAYRELLETGTTRALTLLPPATEAAAAAISSPSRSRPSRTLSVTRPPQGEDEVLETQLVPSADAAAPAGAALQITVHNGDLTFVRQPLLMGHYKSSKLTGAEWVIDRQIGGAMGEALEIGLYPEAPGSHQIFTNTVPDPEDGEPYPEAVIIAGLGEEGKLNPGKLVQTVRQAVLAWAQRQTESLDGAPSELELAATLIASGGIGVTVSQSAQLIAQGVQEANELLDEMREDFQRSGNLARIQWPRVSHLHLVELYLDRATEAWRALQLQAAANPACYRVGPVVETGEGALRRPLESGYRGADYDFISVLSEGETYGEGTISYTLNTKRARTEVRAQRTQSRLLRNLIEKASNDQNTDPQIGRTLFKLLVPVEMEPFLAGTTEMQIEVDPGTAGIPWELLDTPAGGSRDSRPWAIRTKLLRKLRTDDFRSQVNDASADAQILVIGEPACDNRVYPRLPGARREARAVAQRLTGPGGIAVDRVVPLISPDGSRVEVDALAVVNSLFSREWRIIHISGHGEPPERIDSDDPCGARRKEGDPRGVVLSDGTFLGPREVKMLRTVPELVFVNCCYLAARNADQLFESQDPAKLSYNRAQFAATISEELIKLGVRCVIAAGWAVQDDAAERFATTFYEALLRGRRFLDAVGEAREAAYQEGGNTWAAYQCYGDPDWYFQTSVGDAQRPRMPLTDQFAGIASPPGLVLALQTIAVNSQYRWAPAEMQRARIRHLESRFAPRWGDQGKVAEAFGRAWDAAQDPAAAIRWLERAVQAADGGASLAALKRLDELREPAKAAPAEKPARPRKTPPKPRPRARKPRPRK